MASLHKCTFYDCNNEALAEEKNGFCGRHSRQQWYSVKEAARTWHCVERTVRNWINNKQLIAQRRGRRWLIPAEAFKGVYPSECVLPIEQDFRVDMTLIIRIVSASDP